MNLHKENWREVKLGEICKLEYGKTLKGDIRKGGNVPVYGSAGIVGWHNETFIKSGALIVGRKGSIGNVFGSAPKVMLVRFSPPLNCNDTRNT